MTKKDKELLFKELCARLPYHVRCKIWIEDETTEEGPLDLQYNYSDVLQDAFFYNKITLIKPYLRPMSTMTEEELYDLSQYSGLIYDNLSLASFQNDTYKCLDFYLSEIPADVVILVFDWLNSHHFDYRGLIERGLALEASEDMYKID